MPNGSHPPTSCGINEGFNAWNRVIFGLSSPGRAGGAVILRDPRPGYFSSNACTIRAEDRSVMCVLSENVVCLNTSRGVNWRPFQGRENISGVCWPSQNSWTGLSETHCGKKHTFDWLPPVGSTGLKYSLSVYCGTVLLVQVSHNSKHLHCMQTWRIRALRGLGDATSRIGMPVQNMPLAE